MDAAKHVNRFKIHFKGHKSELVTELPYGAHRPHSLNSFDTFYEFTDTNKWLRITAAAMNHSTFKKTGEKKVQKRKRGGGRKR